MIIQLLIHCENTHASSIQEYRSSNWAQVVV